MLYTILFIVIYFTILFSYLKTSRDTFCVWLNKNFNKLPSCHFWFIYTLHSARNRMKKIHIYMLSCYHWELHFKACASDHSTICLWLPLRQRKQDIHFEHCVILLSFVCVCLKGECILTSAFRQELSAQVNMHHFLFWPGKRDQGSDVTPVLALKLELKYCTCWLWQNGGLYRWPQYV